MKTKESPSKKKLEKLLSESTSSAKERESRYLENIAGPFNNSFVLFGAGLLGKKTLAAMRKNGIEPVAFADNERGKWGTTINGLEVFSPQDAVAKFADKTAFIVTIWSPGHSFVSTKTKLHDLGCNIVIPINVVFWKFPDDLLPHYQFELPHKILVHCDDIKKAFDLLTDERSKSCYVGHLESRLFPGFDGLLSPNPKSQYFDLKVMTLDPAEVLVDAGAYSGDTIKSFLGITDSFKQIYAYEPDPESFAELSSFVTSLASEFQEKIEPFNQAVGSENIDVCFNATGDPGAAIVDDFYNSRKVSCVKLDSQEFIEKPTFLKFDIEGAEVEALQGAKTIISNLRPVIAVCVYHLPDHMWKIPLLINSLNKEYHFVLRNYGEDGLDAVLYTIPVSRSKVKRK